MVKVTLDWTGDRSLIVRPVGNVVHVVAHPELSEKQVVTASQQLGKIGPVVVDAWRQALGITAAR